MNVSRLEQAPVVEAQEVDNFAADVLTGFSSATKQLPAKYFYDDIGSELFRAISQHEDYYLTRTEYGILDAISDRLPGILNEKEIDIIELGAGDGHKSELIIDGFLRAGQTVNYYPVDISDKAMEMIGKNIREKPNLSVRGLIGDYFDGLRFVHGRSGNRQLVLFLGSNIGNFDRIQSLNFLRRLCDSLNAGDYILIGFDLKKDTAELITAYSDSSNFTRDFNLNLLTRINRELGGNFDLAGFQHYAAYNPVLGAMESYLLALKEQCVYIEALQREFYFAAFEPIHLEYSFKFLPTDIESLCCKTGFIIVDNFADARERFINSLWQVKEAGSQ